jgi:2-polyprenyl-3-methyl-5-hydroxy-6-metoxy-1,4-benzoquinol methylase
MTVYQRFALFYAKGQYPIFSQHVAEAIPLVCEKYRIPLKGKLLDVACGEGTFAVQMASSGWDVTGIDQSDEMLQFAREQALEKKVKVNFEKTDMRDMDFAPTYDMATCLYDALNYILEEIDLKLTFAGVNHALKPGGWFLFDMNTIQGLAVGWVRQSSYIMQDTEDLVEIHRPTFDYEKQIASLKITGFIRQKKLWERIDEIHQERGYTISLLKNFLHETGFEVVDVVSNLKDFAPPSADTDRVWFVTKKRDMLVIPKSNE